jgi:hypothetical protein
LAFAAALFALLAGCTAVTGGGQFVADGSFDPRTQGDRVTFAFTARPTDDSGAARGQFTLVDHTSGVSIHAELNVTGSGGNSNETAYYGQGAARVRGTGATYRDGSVVVYAVEGDPDYVVVYLYDSANHPVMGWSGDVQNGNVTLH